MTRAHKLAETSVWMPYSYSFIIYMSIAGYLFFDDLPDVWTVVGAGVIVWLFGGGRSGVNLVFDRMAVD